MGNLLSGAGLTHTRYPPRGFAFQRIVGASLDDVQDSAAHARVLIGVASEPCFLVL